MEASERLEIILNHLGMSFDEFAKHLGMSKGAGDKYVGKAEIGKRKSRIKDEKADLFSSLGINYNWYRNGVGNMLIDLNRLYTQTELDFVLVPTIETSFPCGIPQPNDGNIEKYPIASIILQGIKNPYLIKCNGDSMHPTIYDGDWVLTETISGDCTKIRDGEVVVAFINNEFTIKRLAMIENNGFLLLPDNKDVKRFRPYQLTNGDEMQIIAVVKKRITNID